LKAWATGQLEYDLEIAPTIGLIEDVLEILDKFHDEYLKLVANQRKVQRAQFKEQHYLSLSEDLPINDGASAQHGKAVLITEASETRIATMFYTYTLPPELTAADGRAVFLSTSLGLKVDLGTIVRTAWELFPLSFVIDWFLDFGSWLEQFANFNVYFPYEMKDYMESRKLKWTYTKSIYPPQGNCLDAFTAETFRGYGSVYARQRTLPDCGTYFIPQRGDGIDNLKRGRISAAILVANIR